MPAHSDSGTRVHLATDLFDMAASGLALPPFRRQANSQRAVNGAQNPQMYKYDLKSLDHQNAIQAMQPT